MMPKLPHPSVGREWDEPLYTIEQMEYFGRAVAEACAEIGNQMRTAALFDDWDTFARLLAELNEAAQEIGK